MNVDSANEGVGREFELDDKITGGIKGKNKSSAINGHSISEVSSTLASNGGHAAQRSSSEGSSSERSSFLVANPSAINERQRPLVEVMVDQNIEKAMRVLKRKLIREGLFKELKTRRYFEKPCEKRKRKEKESVKRVRKEESRLKKFVNGLL